MRKFVVKIMIAFAYMITVFVVLNGIFKIENKNDSDYTDKFKNISPHIRVANVGSSHGLMSFCYDDIEPSCKCFNFGLVSQSLDYDNRILQYYQDDLEENGVLFIPISYFSFYGVDESQKADYESLNQRYYEILPKKLIKQFHIKNMLLSEFSLWSAKEEILQVFFGHSVSHNDETWQRTTNREAVLVDAEEAYERHIGNKYDESGELMINPTNVDAVYQMITLCKSKSIRPILITTPLMKEYTNLVSEEFLDDFHSRIEQIQRDTGVEYYDYAHDQRFESHYELFLNSDHLNKAGAIQFTDLIFSEILGEEKYIVKAENAKK